MPVMTMVSIQETTARMRSNIRGLMRDNGGVAATEFAVIVPLMLVMFFGMIEVSSGVSVDRKISLVARTLADLASQSTTVTDNDLNNFFAASNGILTPYSSTPTKATITELYVDPLTLTARVQWSKGTVPRSAGSIVSIPTALAVGGTYLIWSEVSYLYTPTIGYVMNKAGVTLSDVSFTRPRQSTCVLYATALCTIL